MKHNLRYKIIALISIVYLISIILPKNVSASNADTKVIRVGYIDYGSFIEEDKNGNYSGYGVEYLEEISKYTGWKYEYVYDTWENCLEMLENGEIDFVGTAQKTPEREQIFSFADIANGVEQTVLYTRIDNEEIYYDDYEAFDGKKIGLLIDSFQTEFFEEYAKEHNFTYEPVYYKTEEKMVTALENGEIDIFAGGSLAMHTDLKVIAKEGADPFYFMTYKGNDETLQELNDAMSQIQTEHPYFAEELAKTYYGESIIVSQPQLTREEAEYIEKADIIKVGCLEDCYPISRWNDTLNAPEGIAIDILEELFSELGLEVQYVKIPAGELPEDYLEQGIIDIMIPTTNTGANSESEVILSEPVLENTMAAVMQQDIIFDSTKNYKVAFVSDYQAAESVVNNYMDSYTPIYYDTVDECINAVKKGEADIYFDNSYIIAYRLKNPNFDSLQENYGHVIRSQYCISARENNAMLINVLNKAIRALDEKKVDDMIGLHTLNSNYDYTFWDRCYENRMALISVSLLILFIIFTFVTLIMIQRKNVQVIEKKNQELEKANQARQMFLSNMSHEIRTPLNGIKGTLDILTERTYDEKTDELLTMSAISANHLLTLVNDILDMSKIESGKIELHKEYVKKSDFFEYLDAIIVPLAKEKRISIEKKLKMDLNESIYVDRNRLSQICINILSNSIKYTDAGGRVVFSVIENQLENDKLKLIFNIEDNGIGMSHEFLEHALEPFVQERISDERSGSGLGLAITRNLISLMDGEFQIESESGVGTNITFAIIVGSKILEEKTTARKEKEHEGKIESKCILIVEDNEINRKIATVHAKSYGFQIEQAVNGQEAVEKFKESEEGHYAMILMDVMMPIMDGLEATKRIRELDRKDADRVVIVAMTANAYVDDIHKSIESGMNAHLSKPFDKAEIYKIFEMVM